MVRYAKSFRACEIEHSEDLKLQPSSRTYSKPPHGGGLEFESPGSTLF